MKKLIITLLILAVMLYFTSMSLARWNDSGFKSSPLFKHALNNAIDRLEGKVNNVSEGDKPTSKAGCSDPKAEETLRPICNTSEITCEGTHTCVGWGTCMGGNTCYSTCASTCSGNTCGATCESTCIGYCPWVQGDCGYNGNYDYNWNSWVDKWVKLFDMYGHNLNVTSFNAWGDYQMESVGYQYLILRAHAKILSGGDWNHAEGQRSFFQDDMTEYVNINLTD